MKNEITSLAKYIKPDTPKIPKVSTDTTLAKTFSAKLGSAVAKYQKEEWQEKAETAGLMEKVAVSFGVIQEVAAKSRLLLEETKFAIRKIESAYSEIDEEDEIRERMVPVRTAITQTKFSTQLQEAENNRLLAAAKGELALQELCAEFERQKEIAAARHQIALAELRDGKQQKMQENYSRQEAENIVSEAIDGNVMTGPTTCYHAFAAWQYLCAINRGVSEAEAKRQAVDQVIYKQTNHPILLDQAWAYDGKYRQLVQAMEAEHAKEQQEAAERRQQQAVLAAARAKQEAELAAIQAKHNAEIQRVREEQAAIERREKAQRDFEAAETQAERQAAITRAALEKQAAEARERAVETSRDMFGTGILEG